MGSVFQKKDTDLVLADAKRCFDSLFQTGKALDNVGANMNPHHAALPTGEALQITEGLCGFQNAKEISGCSVPGQTRHLPFNLTFHLHYGVGLP